MNCNPNIEIRRYNLDDIEPLFKAVRQSISELLKWLPWCHPNYKIEETIEWINFQINEWNNGNEYAFAVYDKSSNIFLGGVGINFINKMNRTGNLGYWIRSDKMNNGIASTSAYLTAKFGFDEIKLNRLEIVMSVDNIASKRVAEKIGAKLEGIARNRLFINEKPTDAFVYSLIKEDCESL